MPIVHAIVLGVTQGLSEFLPISSSGHLIVVPWLFGWHDFTGHGGADLEKAFDVALHMGTFVGAVIYFRRDLQALIRAGWRSLRHRRIEGDAERMAWLLLLSAVPGALVGATLESVIQDKLGQEWLIGIMLIVFGLILLWADRLSGHREANDFRLRDALIMGSAQAIALSPGVSRSGVTMTAGRWLRFDRDSTARLSFLMSLPIIGGAGLYKGLDVATHGGVPSQLVGGFIWGTIAAGVTGFIAIWGLLKIIRTQGFLPFVIYRLVAGTAIIIVAASSFR